VGGAGHDLDGAVEAKRGVKSKDQVLQVCGSRVPDKVQQLETHAKLRSISMEVGLA
jgi:hypothetical protein